MFEPCLILNNNQSLAEAVYAKVSKAMNKRKPLLQDAQVKDGPQWCWKAQLQRAG